MEYVKSAGATNENGPTDRIFREGLDLYWQEYYSSAIPKFEEVKRLFPQHSEVDRLIQNSQQAKAEGKEKSSFPMWVVGVIIAVLFILLVLIIIIAAVVIMMRRRKKKEPAGSPGATGGADKPRHSPGPSPSPSPARAHSPNHGSHKPTPPPSPMPPMPPMPMSAGDQGMTVDLSRTVAITADGDFLPKHYGSIEFVSGPLSGQRFQVRSDGDYIGRDGGSSQIVVADPRISKRHVWIGVRNGRVVIEDQNSRNGTFVNDPKSARVTETSLNAGDTVILGESDVARFEFHA
jgi:hypothetical protein